MQEFTGVGFQLITNSQVELHEQGELEQLVKRKVIGKEILDYNAKLQIYLDECKHADQGTEAHKGRQRKLQKEVGKMNQLNEMDRIAIVNNSFANEAQLILKIQNCENLNQRDRKIILEHQL